MQTSHLLESKACADIEIFQPGHNALKLIMILNVGTSTLLPPNYYWEIIAILWLNEINSAEYNIINIYPISPV